jgi:hypothetical protein
MQEHTMSLGRIANVVKRRNYSTVIDVGGKNASRTGRMHAHASTKRAKIDVTLDVPDALAMIEASFQAAKTATTRMPDHGWTIERADARMVITTKDPRDFLLEPLPDDFLAYFPETLGLEVVARALSEGGSRVRARLIRHRFGATLGALLMGEAIGPFGMNTMLHGVELLIVLRQNRRAAKLRMLRLALEPLVQYEKSRALGPFRG